MKILIDARLYGPKHTGNGRYTMNLVKSLAKIDKKNDYIILLKSEIINSVILPKNWLKVRADFNHYSFSEQIKLPFLIHKFKPDVCHFPHFNVPIFYFGPYIVTIHDLIMHKSKGGEATNRPFPIYQIWRLGYYIAFAKAVYGSKKIIVPTNDVKNDLCNYYRIDKSKIVVTYEGVNDFESQRRFNAKALGNYFVYVGNAYPHKNLDRLVKAIIKFNRGRKEKVILAISSARNVFTQRLLDLINKHKASGFGKLLGHVPDEELFSLYEQSVAFIYPTLIEGFGLPGLEAMKAGTLVYSSDIPVLKEVYKESVSYFDPLDVDSIVNAMNMATQMSNSSRLEKIKIGREFIKKYSWDKMANEVLQIYMTYPE